MKWIYVELLLQTSEIPSGVICSISLSIFIENRINYISDISSAYSTITSSYEFFYQNKMTCSLWKNNDCKRLWPLLELNDEWMNECTEASNKTQRLNWKIMKSLLLVWYRRTSSHWYTVINIHTSLHQ